MKKQALLFSLMIVLFCVLVSGCSLLQQTSSGGGESYFPHAQGNTWRQSSTDGSSQIMTAEGSTSIGSTTVQLFRSTYISSSGSVSTSDAYYRIDSTGVYSHGSSSYPSSIGIPIFSFPLEVGKMWDVMVSGPYSTKCTVLAKENVTVPAGTFDCYKIEGLSMYGTIEVYRSYIWLGNNAGIVKGTSNTSTIESVLQWKNF